MRPASVLAGFVLALAAAAVPVRPLPAQEPTAGAGQTTGATVEVVEETEIDRQVREIASQLRCPVCQGLSLQDSPSELSQEMRDVIRTRLEAGDSPDKVLDYFVARYGEWILLEPRAEGFNLAVYVLPVLAIIAGAALLVFAGRKWMTGDRPHTAGATIDESDPDLAPWDELAPR